MKDYYVIMDDETGRFLIEGSDKLSKFGPFEQALKFETLDELILKTPWLRMDAYIDCNVYLTDSECNRTFQLVKWISKHREFHPYF